MSFLTDNDDGGNSFYKRFRPLIPRPANLESQYHHHSPAGEAMERYSSRQDFHETQQYQLLPTGLNSSNSIVGLCGASSQQPVSSRWNPTVDQLRILEDLYKRGVRTPSAEQIQYITAQLRGYGKIEGKNVFYWFQNHKARERQKRRRRMEMINMSRHPDSATNYLQTQTPTNVVPDHNWNTMRTPLLLQNTVQDCEHFLRLPIPSTDLQQMNYNFCDQQGNCTYQDHKINLLPDEYGGGVIHSQDVSETNQLKTLELFPMYSNNSHELNSSDRTSGMMSQFPASASVNSVEAMDFKYEDGDDEECGQQEHKNEAPCNGYFQFLPLRK